jgi:hypothetical protein
MNMIEEIKRTLWIETRLNSRGLEYLEGVINKKDLDLLHSFKRFRQHFPRIIHLLAVQSTDSITAVANHVATEGQHTLPRRILQPSGENLFFPLITSRSTPGP